MKTNGNEFYTFFDTVIKENENSFIDFIESNEDENWVEKIEGIAQKQREELSSLVELFVEGFSSNNELLPKIATNIPFNFHIYADAIKLRDHEVGN